MGRTIGIDLGTTNSAMAVIDIDGDPVLIANAEGGRTTPSVVARTEDGETIVGVVAERQAAVSPENTLFGVKRLMGQRYSDESVQTAIERYAFEVFPAENGDAWVRLRGDDLPPQEVAAELLRKLKVDAERYLGEDVTDAVITVPAYFDNGQRNATQEAGKLAQLNVVRIINEPTAAALAYGFANKAEAGGDDEASNTLNIVVYDLGGGTFDVSVVRLERDRYEVQATAGDAFLGGEDFDRRIVERLLEVFREETGIELTEDQEALVRVKQAAQQAKHELSTVQRSRVILPYLAGQNLDYELTRDELEAMVVDLVDRTMDPCRRAMEDAGLEVDQIDQIVLVGGQTRMPFVQSAVKEHFGRSPSQGVNPDEVVAIGAAIQGGVLDRDVPMEALLLDVTSQTLGTAIRGDRFSPIVPRNTRVPTEMMRHYVTTKDRQTAITIDVLQGEDPVASANRELGSFEVYPLPPAPAGEVGVDVTFMIDSDITLHASAIHPETGVSEEIEIKGATGLTERQLEEIGRQMAERWENE